MPSWIALITCIILCHACFSASAPAPLPKAARSTHGPTAQRVMQFDGALDAIFLQRPLPFTHRNKHLKTSQGTEDAMGVGPWLNSMPMALAALSPLVIVFVLWILNMALKGLNSIPKSSSSHLPGFHSTNAVAALSGEKRQTGKPSTPKVFERTLITMYVASFILGPLLDNYHGRFGTLVYEAISQPFQLEVNGEVLLQSALWVPFVFGGAGVVMTLLLKVLDDFFKTDVNVRNPSWPKTFFSIAIFSGQYWLSGLMDNVEVPVPIIHVILAVIAVSGWAAVDFSVAGAVLGVCTAFAGIVTEVLLTSLHLYGYTHADFYGVCSWIPWVYFLGAPAVGNLARAVYNQYSRR